MLNESPPDVIKHRYFRPFALDAQIWRCGQCGKQWDDTKEELPREGCVPLQQIHLSIVQLQALVCQHFGVPIADFECNLVNNVLVLKEKTDWKKEDEQR